MPESSGAVATANPFVSSLGKGREAFHAEVTECCLRIGERTAEDFLRHFSCKKIMLSLETRPTERARIISELTGVHEKVAHKLSPQNSGETLQIALDEGVTTPRDIVRLFQPDDRQRYLNRHALWAFNIEGQPWKTTAANHLSHARAQQYTAYIIDRAIANLLVSHEEIVSALGMVKLAGWLPKELLGTIIQASLKKADKFTEEDLLEAVPPSALVGHVPLDYLWERVVVPLIAETHDYVPKKPADPATSELPRSESEGDWPSMRPAAEATPMAGANADKPAGSSADDSDVVGEDEIIETEDEVRASESSPALVGGPVANVRKALSPPMGKKAHG
jgi:hypothetical protein